MSAPRPPAARAPGARDFPAPAHAAAALFTAVAAAVSLTRFSWFGVVMGEDALLEWLTVTCYVAAGVPLLADGIRRRRALDALIGLFCLFVAGEEMSWGQRLLGLTPPTVFLEHNQQQELTLHNFGATRTVFALLMLAYGVGMPLAARLAGPRALLERLGGTPPPVGALPWFVASVVLVRWDPHRLSGEFGETLAAAMFLAARWPARRAAGRRWWPPWAASVAAAGLLTAVSGAQGAAEAERTACAREEADALARDLAAGGLAAAHAARPSTFNRLHLMIRRGQATGDALRTFRRLGCGDADADSDSDARRRFATDPWGVSWFVAVRARPDGAREVVVQSYGPNRRREGTVEGGGGDDVMAAAPLPR